MNTMPADCPCPRCQTLPQHGVATDSLAWGRELTVGWAQMLRRAGQDPRTLLNGEDVTERCFLAREGGTETGWALLYELGADGRGPIVCPAVPADAPDAAWHACMAMHRGVVEGVGWEEL